MTDDPKQLIRDGYHIKWSGTGRRTGGDSVQVSLRNGDLLRELHIPREDYDQLVKWNKERKRRMHER